MINLIQAPSPESAGVEDVVEAVKTFSADVASATWGLQSDLM